MLHRPVIPTLLLALALVGCVRVQELDGPEAGREAVVFDVYARGTETTKAGFAGDLDAFSFKGPGFGVYGYVSASEPDFMKNQHISWNGSAWTYSPLKYWPNDNDVKVSFFAYAPYVASAPFNKTDALTEAAKVSPAEDGILYIPASDAATPEIVYRMADKPENGVDLMYGVDADGLPFLNMGKQKLGEKIEYHFRHSLTKLTVNVDADFDKTDPNTRVVIERVNLKTDKLATYGTLNLNNTAANTPLWTPGTTLSAFNTNAGYDLPVAYGLKYVAGSDDTPAHYSQQPLGVTGSTQPLMGYTPDGVTPASLLLVPNSAGTGDLTITIGYRIITRDAQVTGGYLESINEIQSTIAAASMPFAPGTSNTLNLHLGIASVRCDASVADWGGTSAGSTLPVLTIASETPVMLWPGIAGIATASIKDGANDVSDNYTYSWESSNTSVVSSSGETETGTLIPAGVGEATITVTATKTSDSSKQLSTSFKVYVNAVTGLSLVTSASRIVKTETATLTPTITVTSYGPVTLPANVISYSTDAFVTVVKNDDNTATATGAKYGGDPRTVTATILGYYTSSGIAITATTQVNCAPPGTTGYLFSVSATKKVYIASGNLQATYDGTAWTWHLAPNQYSIVGNAVGNTHVTSPETDETIDLFGWSADGNTKFGIDNSTDDANYSGSFRSWTNNPIFYYGTSTDLESRSTKWRVLTGGDGAEWNFLLLGRGENPLPGGLATVNGVYGLLSLPDNWTGDAINATLTGWADNVFTAEQWAALEAKGAVFLPCAGYREGDTVTHVGEWMNYWSQSPSGDTKAFSAIYDSTNKLDVKDIDYRHYGISVRLVRDVDD